MSASTEPEVELVVCGSLNVDYRVGVDSHPAPGETVIGDQLRRSPGGKGANQAVSAAVHTRVAMIGRVGADIDGELLTEVLDRSGVERSAVAVDAEAPTGAALIVVNADGENSIVVAPGANHRLSAQHATDALERLRPDALLLLQGELALDTTVAVLEYARGRGQRVVLNLAPVLPVPPESLRGLQALIVNRSEAAAMLGEEHADAAGAARELAALGVEAAIVTDGDGGVVAAHAGRLIRVPAMRVARVVDTTGAGDAFCGAFAAASVGSSGLEASLRTGITAAASAIQRPVAMLTSADV